MHKRGSTDPKNGIKVDPPKEVVYLLIPLSIIDCYFVYFTHISARDCVNVISICEDAKIIYINKGMGYFNSIGNMYKSVKLVNPQTDKE